MPSPDHAAIVRDALDDAFVSFPETMWERAYRNTARPALNALAAINKERTETTVGTIPHTSGTTAGLASAHIDKEHTYET